jgi:hypothetical protein
VRAVQRRLLAKPGLSEKPRCDACHRLMQPADMVSDLCRDCHTERSDAFYFSDEPFLEDE